jgi:hypothetical protein
MRANVEGHKFKGLSAFLLVCLLVSLTGTPVTAVGLLPLNNPKANFTPHPDFLTTVQCTSAPGGWSCANPCASSQTASLPVYTNSPTCTSYLLQIINAARKRENVQPMVLPTNWYSLTAGEQLFVLADLERTARGLPPYLGINRVLERSAQTAARSGTDPSVAPGFAIGLDAQKVPGMGGTWSTGFMTLEADFLSMYNDGWNGSRATTFNVLCTSARAPACWGHRDELLGYDGKYDPGVGLSCRNCEMGTGFAEVNGQSSFTDLVELPAASAPPMIFTWAKNVAPYLAS